MLNLPLKFHRQILRQLVPQGYALNNINNVNDANDDAVDEFDSLKELDPSDSGLLILARGLGLRKILCSFLTLQSDPRRLILIINANPNEEDGIGDLLGTMGVSKPGLRVVNFDMISKQRDELYKQGGLVSVTSRILVVDMLNGTIPVNLISGLIILHADQVTPTSIETFIARIYRKHNKDGFLKAFSDQPELFTSGVSPLQTVMRSLMLRKVWIWPRFHENIQQDLEKCKADVVELYPSLTKSMKEIQTSIIECMEATLSEITKGNTQHIDVEDFTIENALFRSFDKVVRMQLDPIWHLVRPKTKQLVGDLSVLRRLLSYILFYDCVTFQSFIETILATNLSMANTINNQNPSQWLYMDSANIIINVSKSRVYKEVKNVEQNNDNKPSWVPPGMTPVLEEQPKWSVLTEVLEEIDNNINFGPIQSNDDPGNNTILVMCESDRTVLQLTEYLNECENIYGEKIKRAPKMMRKLFKNYLNWKGCLGSLSRNLRNNNKSNLNQPQKPPQRQTSIETNSSVNEDGRSAALLRKEQFRRNESATAYGHNRRRVRGGSVIASVQSSRPTQSPINKDGESMLEKEAISLSDFQSQRKQNKGKKNDEVINIEEEDDENDEIFFNDDDDYQLDLMTGSIGDFNIDDENLDLIEPNQTIIIRSYKDDDDDTLLDEILPRYVIMYDPDPAFVRRIEVYKSSYPSLDVRLYFLMYANSVEEQRYLSGLRKEKDSFERLIREKANMLLPIYENESSTASTDHYLNELSSRVAGGQDLQTDSQAKVIVDVREFRSTLPGILHASNFEVIPTTLTIGDYVLDPTMCVERKSIPDLISSFNTGRLYTQCELMSTHYKIPILLIEFEESRSFTLDTVADGKKKQPQLHLPNYQPRMRMDDTTPSDDIQSKLVLLTISFPRLKIIWSSSPRATSSIFKDLKVQRDEPDVKASTNVGTEETGTLSENGILMEENLSLLPNEIVRNLPGITTKNAGWLTNKVNNINEVVKLKQKECIDILGVELGTLFYKFINNNVN